MSGNDFFHAASILARVAGIAEPLIFAENSP